jgi:hypothetical protein
MSYTNVGLVTRGFCSRSIEAAPVATGDIIAELRAFYGNGDADQRINIGITEIGFSLLDAVATTVDLARAPMGTSNGADEFIGLSEQDTGLGFGLVVNAWTVPPVPGDPMRSHGLPAAIGNSHVWQWSPEAPLIVPSFNSIVLVNSGALNSGTLKVWMKWATGMITSQPSKRSAVGDPVSLV